MIASEQSEYIVQCVREAGSMYEEDARAFLAEHGADVRAAALREAADLAEQRTGGPAEQHILLDFATQLRREALAREKGAAPAPTATPGFFQVDHTYGREHHGDTITFKVTAISTSPDGRLTVAHGWRTGPDSEWEPTDSDDFTGWTDVTPAGGR